VADLQVLPLLAEVREARDRPLVQPATRPRGRLQLRHVRPAQTVFECAQDAYSWLMDAEFGGAIDVVSEGHLRLAARHFNTLVHFLPPDAETTRWASRRRRALASRRRKSGPGTSARSRPFETR
jgi:hypothetical protein